MIIVGKLYNMVNDYYKVWERNVIYLIKYKYEKYNKLVNKIIVFNI